MTTPTTPGPFRKTLPTARANAEEFGWLQVAGRLQVPALLERTRHDAHTDVITYENVFASGRCRLLLGDLIALADHGHAPTSDVADLIDAVCDDLITAAAATGRTTALSACVPALYADRIRPGGRVDDWYLNQNLTVTDTHTGERIPLHALTGYTATVNGTPLQLDVPAAINTARTALHFDSQWTSAITQGDPTEPNIAVSAVGACWLDFEHAGRNTLAGEIANLLWYLLALGGWLVPTYQHDVYTRTMTLHLPPTVTPTIERAELSTRHRQLHLHYTWPTGPGRQTALTRLLARITTDLGDAADLPSGRQLHALGPFLTLRILGVIPPRLLTPTDLLLLLAKLAQAQNLKDNNVPFTHTDPLTVLAPVEAP
ncbi:hypothetical protein [Streptomyces sp. BE133]|uniref:hypothetical protein n=1 Tax=Streptomyces sp. BE133 TaxID=3002523 RepID=UPI002E778F02|nr:hypothetical protein [Streptomyces sp. BE133]MEE1806715.1 hypothetical protein [Streptomyces sp. BE133]